LYAIRIVLVTAVDELFAAFEQSGVGVHEVRNLNVFHATERSHVGSSASLDAAYRDVYSFVSSDYLARRLGPANGEGPERRRGEGGLFDEVSTALAHGVFSPVCEALL
jgi:hypothetical protein